MTTFFTSDTHFGHTNIIKYVNRPFKTAEAMDEAMIYNWNSVVKSTDIVYHNGDFAFGQYVGAQYIAKVSTRLNGIIHLIEGNHEKLANLIQWRFASIKKYDEVEVEGQRIVLFHYGLRTWHHDLRGVWHLYGHSHGGLEPYGKSLDIGVDKWNFTPVSFVQLKEVMDKQPTAKHPTFDSYIPGGNNE